jgi:hypothetical protein
MMSVFIDLCDEIGYGANGSRVGLPFVSTGFALTLGIECKNCKQTTVSILLIKNLQEHILLAT